MVETDYQIYVGIDWGSEAHQACVLDHERRIVAERSFAHAGDAIAEFAQWLRELADDPGRVAIAIEIPRGAIVETLVERGFEVYAINPKQLDRFRDRYSYYKRTHVRKLFHRLDGWIRRRIWSHRYRRWRCAGWKELPEARLYGEYGLVNLIQLIPSLASQWS